MEDVEDLDAEEDTKNLEDVEEVTNEEDVEEVTKQEDAEEVGICGVHSVSCCSRSPSVPPLLLTE